MPTYITVMGQKGGVGKTTTTINLANYFFHGLGKKTLAVDTDFQKSLSNQRVDETWNEKRKSFDIKTCVTEDSDTLHTMLNFFEQNYEVIIVDTPGKLKTGLSTYLVEISDLVLIPFRPSNKDIKSNLQLVDAISNVFGDDLPVYGFFNMIKAGAKETEQLREFTGYRCLKMLKHMVRDSVAISRQNTYDPVHRDDVQQLFDELNHILSCQAQKIQS
ncbi:MAG TPA: hypothetical protein DDY13_06035 [Cytophagales bacterium]|jgi:cellulose biosynthesis protein BcsQ|nr:hypothetical protein [Cytophagales bacterium]